MASIYRFLLERGIEIQCDTQVESFRPCSEGYEVLLKDREDSIQCTYLIGAPGRAGAEWFSDQCEGLGLELTNNQVDVGVRVEVPAAVFQEITDEVYEAKLVYRTKGYGDRVRTFCMNPNGRKYRWHHHRQRA